MFIEINNITANKIILTIKQKCSTANNITKSFVLSR